jgi:protein-tyrosine kinase
MNMEQTHVVSSGTSGARSDHGERSIGALLVLANRITPENNERVLRLQRELGLRYGDAAIQLGLLTQADIESTLTQQFNYPQLRRGESGVSGDLIAAYTHSGPEIEALRALRAQLNLRWFETDPDHRALAIVSGERKEGRSFIVANLAVAFSLLGKRTLLIDADMRHPCQHTRFGLSNRAGLSAVLSGRGQPEMIQKLCGLPDLSVLPAGVLPPNPSELVARPLFSEVIKELKRNFEIILLDSPATSECADAQTISIKAGAALIVARKNVTKLWRMRGVSDAVIQTNATVVGTILNDF